MDYIIFHYFKLTIILDLAYSNTLMNKATWQTPKEATIYKFP